MVVEQGGSPNVLDPATESKQDEIIENQTDGSQKTGIVTNGADVGVQNPLSTDGDSVYCKDVWVDESIVTNWVDEDGAGGDIACIPFNNLHTIIKNTTSDNPKILRIHFNRTVFATQVGLGCVGTGESFSNVCIKALGSGGVERIVKDESTNNSKYTSRNYFFSKQELFNAIQIEFNTTDDICLSNITIQKAREVSVGQVERTTNSLKTIDYSHAEIHGGSHYFYKDFYNLLKNETVEHLIVTPDTTKWAHMTLAFEAVSSSITIELYENISTTTDGTVEQVRNRNRNFSDNNTTEVYLTPTGVTGDTIGNLLWTGFFGAGKNSDGGGTRDSEEILLKQNTKYLVRVTESATVESDTVVNVNFDWYEHTNKGEPEE